MMRETAYVTHRTAHRLRIKIPARRHDATFFGDLQRQLIERPLVVAVDVNPLTASVLIRHRGAFEQSELRHPLLGLELHAPASSADYLAAAIRRLFDLDRRLQRTTGGKIGVASVLVTILLIVAARRFAARSEGAPQMIWRLGELLMSLAARGRAS
jgi:hypothetical protein